jgi:hypothetical protein
VLAVWVQFVSEMDAGIAEVPPDCRLGLAERVSDLVAVDASGDAIHDHTLGWR